MILNVRHDYFNRIKKVFCAMSCWDRIISPMKITFYGICAIVSNIFSCVTSLFCNFKCLSMCNLCKLHDKKVYVFDSVLFL